MNLFDAIIIGITLILGIKGFFNGFIKEIAGLIGIISGFFIASTYYHKAGMFINENILNIPNKSAIDLVGFIAVFVGVWLFIVFIGFLFSKMLKVSSLGLFDKLLGFLFSSMKFFILVSIILVLLYKVEFLKESLDKYTKNSFILPIMLNLGEKVINISPKDVKNRFKDVKISLNYY